MAGSISENKKTTNTNRIQNHTNTEILWYTKIAYNILRTPQVSCEAFSVGINF